MTAPTDDDLPEACDIALEQATPEQVEALEAASDDESD
jgi:DNA-binding FadR family transcriptional regulator